MLPQNVILALASAGLISALPLNINLGAYSPALVVGDGEISLGNAESAGNLMETLASGAATASQQAGQATPAAGEAAQPAAAQAQGITAGPNPASTGETAAPAAPAPEKRGMISKGLDPSLKIPALPRPNMEKRSLETRSPEISSSDSAIIKREIAGFREALNFAINAMKNQPTVELGTGQEGSGVGVIVNPGLNVPAGSPAAGRVVPTEAASPAARKEKRYVMPGAGIGAEAEAPKSGITLMAIAEI